MKKIFATLFLFSIALFSSANITCERTGGWAELKLIEAEVFLCIYTYYECVDYCMGEVWDMRTVDCHPEGDF